jgi:hypothetical protein
MSGLPRGVAGIPAGVPQLGWFELPAWVKLGKAEAEIKAQEGEDRKT